MESNQSADRTQAAQLKIQMGCPDMRTNDYLGHYSDWGKYKHSPLNPCWSMLSILHTSLNGILYLTLYLGHIGVDTPMKIFPL